MNTSISQDHNSQENELETRVENDVNQLGSLIDSVEKDASNCPVIDSEMASQLVSARLGIATGLFESIRMKHSSTAIHCLRVALGCSAWFEKTRPDLDKNELEIAALLHDLGKIGVPDEILSKPSQLNVDERRLVDAQRKKGLEVLTTFCGSQNVIDYADYAATWFDGSRNASDLSGEQLPLGARMIAIADAFDSMTTDQVYRKALSIDRAVAELFENAGTQFDPELVKSFSDLIAQDWFELQVDCCRQWAKADPLEDGNASALWSVTSKLSHGPVARKHLGDELSDFKSTLHSQMLDGVIFVDRQGKILFWNPAAERITGLTSAAVLERRFCPSLVELHDDAGVQEIPDNECPIQRSMSLGETQFARYSLRGRTNSRHVIDLQVAPVIGQSGESLGATLVLHDSSNTCSLEERVESLYSRASQDPLTRVANRAEFDRVHAEFVEHHLTEATPCSLIICDIDFFKKVNDDFGHQAGDEALIAFAALLKRFHRVGDLVARYGGEEFVLLCAGCDNKTATERAEEIRHALQSTPLEALNNKCLTASFGVTEVQQGDSPDLMLRRADRALIMAKENGRNRVVQLGAGMDENFEPLPDKKKAGFFDWFKKKAAPPEEPIQQTTLISQVPLELAIQKLKGFVTDQEAQIVEVEDNDISIKVSGQNLNFGKRANDRPVPFNVLLQFSSFVDENLKKRSTKTRIHVVISPIRTRDRRKVDLQERAKLIINSIKSYLMASSEDEGKNKASMLERAATESGR